MERKVVIQDWQKVTQEDFDSLGEFPRESFDDLIENLLIPDKGYAGFGTVESGTAEVTVSAGRMVYAGVMFLNDTEGGTVVSLLASLPSATQRYVALTAWGQEIDTETEPRTFLTDATTRATVARAVSTENRRWANISTVVGTEGPDPTKPAIAANVVPFAWVLLDTSGIVSVEMDTDYLMPTLREADTRLNAFDAWKTAIGARIDTLASDLAGLAARLKDTARLSYVLDVARDLARTKEALNLPDAFVMWGSDHFLDNDESDTAHVDWYALSEEGARFPDAAVEDSQIGLLNQYDPQAHQQDFFVIPAFTEKARISVVAKDTEQNISSYQYQTISYDLKARQRSRWRFGPYFIECTNRIFFDDGDEVHWVNRAALIFKWAGEVWQLNPNDADYRNHEAVRIRRAWFDTWTEYYLETVVTNTSISGACVAQTFLNSQDGWMTSIDLYFTRVAATGDVTMLICETTNGAPDLTKVISTTVIDVEDLHVYPTPTNVPVSPLFLAAGQRFGIILVTGANHYVAVATANKYAQGSWFYSTDSVWFQGDLEKDLSMTLYFASFAATRYEINLLPIGLQNGIAGIDILCETAIPPQTEISWEVQPSGEDWVSLNLQGGDTPPVDPFVGLHANMQFRVVLTGTTDSMPGFGVSSKSRVITRRPAPTMRHISTARTTETPVDNVIVDLRLEAWRGAAHHSCLLKLLWADAQGTETYDALVEHVAPDDPNAWIQRYTFSGMTNDDLYRLRIEGTTDNVLTCFHVAERIDVATLVS